MTNRIDRTFSALSEQGQKAFIAYISAGDPDLEFTLALLKRFDQLGVDAVELGVPFSDPIGDGPVNQAGAKRGLDSGTTLDKVLKTVKRFRADSPRLPVILFSYLNPLYHFGLDRFPDAAVDAGVDGVLAVDGPFDMCGDLNGALKQRGIHSIYLASPTTSPSRLRQIARQSGGFLYYISSMGVTGMRRSFEKDLGERVQSIRSLCRIPVCVGFGISTPEAARSICRKADGIIVGSAFVRRIEDHLPDKNSVLRSIDAFTRKMVRSVKSVS
jgi:tryptophan synthase alpha chain